MEPIIEENEARRIKSVLEKSEKRTGELNERIEDFFKNIRLCLCELKDILFEKNLNIPGTLSFLKNLDEKTSHSHQIKTQDIIFKSVRILLYGERLTEKNVVENNITVAIDWQNEKNSKNGTIYFDKSFKTSFSSGLSGYGIVSTKADESGNIISTALYSKDPKMQILEECLTLTNLTTP